MVHRASAHHGRQIRESGGGMCTQHRWRTNPIVPMSTARHECAVTARLPSEMTGEGCPSSGWALRLRPHRHATLVAKLGVGRMIDSHACSTRRGGRGRTRRVARRHRLGCRGCGRGLLRDCALDVEVLSIEDGVGQGGQLPRDDCDARQDRSAHNQTALDGCREAGSRACQSSERGGMEGKGALGVGLVACRLRPLHTNHAPTPPAALNARRRAGAH